MMEAKVVYPNMGDYKEAPHTKKFSKIPQKFQKFLQNFPQICPDRISKGFGGVSPFFPPIFKKKFQFFNIFLRVLISPLDDINTFYCQKYHFQ